MQDGDKVGNDKAGNIVRDANTFNKYITPGIDNADYWSTHSTKIHGLTSRDPRILQAGNMPTVWTEFQNWVRDGLDPLETAIRVACNGEACDLKWL